MLFCGIITDLFSSSFFVFYTQRDIKRDADIVSGVSMALYVSCMQEAPPGSQPSL